MDGAIVNAAKPLLAFSGLLLAGGISWAQAVSSPTGLPLSTGSTEIPVEAPEGLAGKAFAIPSDGCFSVVFEVPMPPNPHITKITQSMQSSMAADKLTLREATKPEDTFGSASSFHLNAEQVTGFLTLQIDSTQKQARAAACYWTQRSPERCESLCRAALTKFTQTTK